MKTSAHTGCIGLFFVINYYSVIIIPAERELERDTCREGVEKKNIALIKCVMSDRSTENKQMMPQFNQMISDQHLAKSNKLAIEAKPFHAAVFDVHCSS